MQKQPQPKNPKNKIASIEKQITQHLNALEKNGQEEQETDLPSAQQCQELLKKLKDKKIDLEKLLTQAQKKAKSQP
jgi:hypothetical protein